MQDKRVYILNALWFKTEGGRERYKDYLSEADPFIKGVGGRKFKSFIPIESLVGDFDADLVFFIEYPNLQAFQNLMNNEDYQKVLELREEAVEKSLLIRCQRPI